MLSMTLLKIVSISLFAALVGVWTFGGSEDLDQRIPVGPGGSLDVAIALGDGFSFDHGSLQIRSHTDDDVRVRAETSGWGGYAVALELSHDDAAQHVALVGKVEGALHWMFGGPGKMAVKRSSWLTISSQSPPVSAGTTLGGACGDPVWPNAE